MLLFFLNDYLNLTFQMYNHTHNKLYTFIPVWVTLIKFQDHSHSGMMKLVVVFSCLILNIQTLYDLCINMDDIAH